MSSSPIDKREIDALFGRRLRLVMERAGLSKSAFADSIGVDRSALSQILSERHVRLPRAETLVAIASRHEVSLDWLLGLSQSDQLATELAPTLAIELGGGRPDDSRVEQWRREAIGYKIRYAPATLPDLLRTNEVIRWEFSTEEQRAQGAIASADIQIAYSRRTETDMEVAMPLQRLTGFAKGEGKWHGLSLAARRAQVAHIATLLDELYPTFRLFLYDEREGFSAPYTVFGPLRAAIYIGESYLVLNATEHIRALSDHFDRLIRRAKINPHEAAAWAAELLKITK